MSKIIGVTVGTPTSPAKMEEELKPVKTVNGIAPDKNGNVEVAGGSGEAGADGFSPIANVTQTDSGAVISITDKRGTTTATITNGKDGAKGEKGDTGPAYTLTASDKAEMVSAVIASLPIYNGEVVTV